jgi:hypothetical protein
MLAAQQAQLGASSRPQLLATLAPASGIIELLLPSEGSEVRGGNNLDLMAEVAQRTSRRAD